MEIEELDLIGVIAFDGTTRNALQLHPDEEHLVYPMGSKVVIKNIITGKQTFLVGHTNAITALNISVCGKFIASGQITHPGFKAKVIIWNYNQQDINTSHEIHKVMVQDVRFSCDSKYLISLGGRDDNNLVVFDITNKEPLCGSYASHEISGNAYTISRTNLHGLRLISAGDKNLKVWRIDPKIRKIFGANIKVGKLKRTINCIAVDAKDELIYCGTSTGDIIVARLNFQDDEEEKPSVMVGCYSKVSRDRKKKNVGEGDLFPGGIQNLLILQDKTLIIGTGNGNVEKVEIANVPVPKSKIGLMPNKPQLITHMSQNVCSSVTSMILYKTFILIGTASCEIYQIQISNFDLRLLITCHVEAIHAIEFPHNFSEVFATGGKDSVRLWQLENQKELLRITVPNFVCNAVCFSYDGRMIISAWNDGVVRACTPQTGKLIFAIHNAHVKAVTAVIITPDGSKLITGGCDGQVRLWDISLDVQRLVHVFKEHKGPITSLHFSPNKEDIVSSSADGTCIIWSIPNTCRKQFFMGNTMFMGAKFNENGVQLITCGTDRKIGYWETLDGSLIRETEGSKSGALNTIDISSDGQLIVSGSADCILKIWNYETADTVFIGNGHAAGITACKFSPNGKFIVSVSADGAIMIWTCPSGKKSTVSTSRSNKSVKSQQVSKEENVSKLTARSDTGNSIKSNFEGNQEQSCMYNAAEPSKDSCDCKMKMDKIPFSEKGSTRSIKSNS
ncbi:cilia- and flagella-associated protein 52 [Prorops nasuta]|uniref:cilia- and flagella-associated protein 52 n=1 Tax=Prorops nasuta TaxID=863751 RepID=UPI0034CF37A3